jgi:hypothetical protein
MYRSVHDLSHAKLEELRDSLYTRWLDEGKINVDVFDGITDKQLFSEYEDTNFVDDDFFCNQSDYIVEV